MRKILFITNRNILTTSGELRLIKNRAEALFSYYGIATDFIVWQKKNRIESPKREKIDCSGKIDTYVLSTFNILHNLRAYRAIKKELKKRVKTKEYSAVVLSGSGMANLAGIIKRNSDIKIIMDVHGSSEDVIKLTENGKLPNKIISRIIYSVETKAFRKNFGKVDGCFVVTHALKKYLKERYRISDKTSFYIAPCATDSTEIKEDDYYRNRAEYREKYGIDDETKVLIYSGGVSSWQCIKETVELFKAIKKTADFPVTMLMFSHRSDIIKEFVGDEQDILIDSYRPEELKKALCAGDVAIMLRKDCTTNNVAFPNKFLEYTASCMNIITTPYVYDIAEQIKTNGIGFLYDFEENAQDVADYIKNSKRKDFSVYEKVLTENGFKERLKKFDGEI